MKKILVSCICLILSIYSFGKVDVEGSFDVLEETNQTTLGVLFDYSQAKIDNIAVKVYAKQNDKDWNSLSQRLESRFIEETNDEVSQCRLIGMNDTGYSYFVKVSFYSIDEDGECTIAIRLFEKNNEDKVIGLIELSADSQRGDWDEALEDSYNDLGEKFGKFLDKKVF